MGYLDRTRVHHCPGEMGKVDGFPGNCSKKKNRHCETHQELCPRHPNWAYMKSKSCEICEQEEMARERYAIPPVTGSNMLLTRDREARNERRAAENDNATNRRGATNTPNRRERTSENTPESAPTTPPSSRKAKEAVQKKINILAQHLEDVTDENDAPSHAHSHPIPYDFNERKRMAAEILEQRGWPALRDALSRRGVSEGSLPSEEESATASAASSSRGSSRS